MSKDALPQKGGSFIREPDGTLIPAKAPKSASKKPASEPISKDTKDDA